MHLSKLQTHLDKPGVGLGPSVGVGYIEREEGADAGVNSHGLEQTFRADDSFDGIFVIEEMLK